MTSPTARPREDLPPLVPVRRNRLGFLENHVPDIWDSHAGVWVTTASGRYLIAPAPAHGNRWQQRIYRLPDADDASPAWSAELLLADWLETRCPLVVTVRGDDGQEREIHLGEVQQITLDRHLTTTDRSPR